MVGLLGWLLVAFAAAAVGAIASVDAASFYAQLNKPSWAPPASVFGPVWSVLYALMGVSAWLVWRAPGPKKAALALFCVQLAANALWSWLFFAWHQGALAAVEVLVLLALIVCTVAAFFSHQPSCRSAVGPVSAVGGLCILADMVDLAEQPGSSVVDVSGSWTRPLHRADVCAMAADGTRAASLRTLGSNA